MNDPVWGGALSSFCVDFDQYGENFNTSFEYSVLGLSADNAIGAFNILSPDYIKIDVDGIEHLIIEGASHILKTVKSVLVEIDESFITEDFKADMIGMGLAENIFKPNISEIKNKYKKNDIPEWIMVEKNKYIRVK